MTQEIPFDVWALILAFISDPATLASCARVCHVCHDAAVPILYRKVEVTVPFVLESDRQRASANAFRTLSACPHLRSYVRAVSQTFKTKKVYDAAYSTWRNWWGATVDTYWTSTLALLPNLSSYTLSTTLGVIGAPPPDILRPIVAALSQCSRLAEVQWSFRLHPASLSTVRRLKAGSLRTLTVGAVGPDVTSAFGDYARSILGLQGIAIKKLDGMDRCLTELSANGCLSRLTRLVLGDGLSLSRDVILDILKGTPYLEYLQFSYAHWAGHESHTFPGLSRLRELSVRHEGVSYWPHSDLSLISWITTVAGKSPLEQLVLQLDPDARYESCAFFASTAKQYPSLTALHAPAYVMIPAEFRDLLRDHPRMENMVFSVRASQFAEFQSLAGSSSLSHTAESSLTLPASRRPVQFWR